MILTQYGKAAAVMVAPAHWNAIIVELEDYRDTVSAIETLEEYEKDPLGAKPWEEVKAELVAEGLIDD